MDFLNQAYRQVVDLFRSMTPAARVTTGLLLLAVIASLTFLFQTNTDVADDYLFGAQLLSQRELDAMEIAFGTAGLSNGQVKQHRMMVPRTQRAAYLKALADEGALPLHPGVAAGKMLANQSALESRDVRDQRARLAKQTDLEAILSDWDSIEYAYVMIDELDSGGFRRQKALHASVSVHMAGAMRLDEQLAHSIRSMVANGAGMDIKDVAVMDAATSRSFGSDEDGQGFGAHNEYAELQLQYENRTKQKVEELLDFIQDVGVAVYVELDKDLATRSETSKYDAQPVTIRSSEYSNETSTTTPQRAQRPGTAANVVGLTAQSVDNTPPAENTGAERRDEIDNVAGSTREYSERAGLVPKMYRVSVRVPNSYFVEVWHEENPPDPGAEPGTPPDKDLERIQTETITMIENQVANILPPVPPGDDQFLQLVDVQAYPDLSVVLPAGPSTVDRASTWFAGNWQTIGMFVFAILGITMLRGMLRAANGESSSTEAQTIPINTLAMQQESFDEEEEEDDDPNSLKHRFNNSGRSLRDELTELVREDPDAAANVLKNWIGEAA